MAPEEIGKVIGLLGMLFQGQDFKTAEEAARWSLALQGVPGSYDDAQAAAVAVMQRQGFIKPHELIIEMRVIRDRRLENVAITEVFGPDDRYRPELMALRKQIADGGRGAAQLTGAVGMVEPREPGKASPGSVQARAEILGQTPDFVRLRDEARMIPCAQCYVPAGEPCISSTDGRPLTKVPAHRVRLEEAGLVEATPRRTAEDYRALLRERMAEYEREGR